MAGNLLFFDFREQFLNQRDHQLAGGIGFARMGMLVAVHRNPQGCRLFVGFGMWDFQRQQLFFTVQTAVEVCLDALGNHPCIFGTVFAVNQRAQRRYRQIHRRTVCQPVQCFLCAGNKLTGTQGFGHNRRNQHVGCKAGSILNYAHRTFGVD